MSDNNNTPGKPEEPLEAQTAEAGPQAFAPDEQVTLSSAELNELREQAAGGHVHERRA